MSLSAAVVRELVAAGLQGQALIEACERIEAATDHAPTRTARQERNRRYYERKASEKRLNASYSDALSPPEVSPPAPPLPTPSIPLPPSPPKGGSSPTAKTPRQELEAVLDAERAQAVVDHRSRIRKPLTSHAAKLLAGKFRQAADPNAAADMMVANGWQGFEPSWAENRGREKGRSPPAAKWTPRNAGELALQELGLINEHGDSTHHAGRRDDTGDEAGPAARTGAPVLVAVTSRSVGRNPA